MKKWNAYILNTVYGNSLLAVTISVCYSYCLVNLGHKLYILYHLTFVVIVWLYKIRNYGPCVLCLGTVWINSFKTTDKNKVNCFKLNRSFFILLSGNLTVFEKNPRTFTRQKWYLKVSSKYMFMHAPQKWIIIPKCSLRNVN